MQTSLSSLSLRNKSVLAGGVNSTYPVWYSSVSNPTGEVWFWICCICFSFAGKGDVLDIMVHLLDAIVSDAPDSYHLPIVFNVLGHVRTRALSDPVEKFTDWDRFEGLASDLVSPRIEINSGVEVDKAMRNFTPFVASAYRLSTCKVTLSDLNSDLSGLDRLLKHIQRLRRLWYETRDTACKTGANWVTKTIRRMSRRGDLERWEITGHR
jgi:hypothetical protein